MSTTTTTTTTTTPHIISTPPQYAWQTGPMKLIPTPKFTTGEKDDFAHSASEMALVHNCIIRAFNTIYHQAPHIIPSDYVSFTSYCISTWECLEAHHTGEEEFMFPEIQKLTGIQDLMAINISQHAAFHTGFHAWGAWLQAVHAGTETFDGKRCVELMDAFTEPLAQHLAEEIPTILGLREYKDVLDIRALMKAEAEKVMAAMSKTTQLPLIFLNHDVTYEGGIHNFPPVPTPVVWVLREVFGRWHASWWKFAACSYDGKPKDLHVKG